MTSKENKKTKSQKDATKDVLPEDLDAQKAYRGPYLFPNTKRRQTAGISYIVIAILIALLGRNNIWVLSGCGFIILVAVHHILTAWDIKITQNEALSLAGQEVDFSVGHASGRIFWFGVFSKPVWQIAVFSSEPTPKYKGLVEINAINGNVISSFKEENDGE